MMRFSLYIIALIIILVSVASPVVLTQDLDTSDSSVAALDFDVNHFHNDPDCPTSAGGNGGGC